MECEVSRSSQMLCKRAYWQYLEGGSFIEVAVQAACEAIELGAEDPDTYRLAGANDDESNDVLRMLKALARRQHVELPNPDSEGLWLLRIHDELESCGLTYGNLTNSERFLRDVNEIGLALAAWSARHGEMDVAEFAIHLRKHPDNYDFWLGRLARKSGPAERRLRGTAGQGLCAGVTETLSCTAYGDISEASLIVSAALVQRARVFWGQFVGSERPD